MTTEELAKDRTPKHLGLGIMRIQCKVSSLK